MTVDQGIKSIDMFYTGIYLFVSIQNNEYASVMGRGQRLIVRLTFEKFHRNNTQAKMVYSYPMHLYDRIYVSLSKCLSDFRCSF